MNGTLYLVATPIGNMSDVSSRSIEILKNVSLVAAEDTRVTGSFLKKLDIKKPLVSYFEHNAVMREEKLISELLSGNDIAIVSDAGTPAISDPGEVIVKKCIELDIDVVPIPGPCAFVCALIVSGFSTKQFTFVGFLPSKEKEREKELTKYENYKETLIFYEAPHRLLKTLNSIKNILGSERKLCISREITKKFEEHKHFNAKQAVDYYTSNPIKGEFVIIAEGNSNIKTEDFSEITLESHLDIYLNDGLTKNESIKSVAKDRGVSKREIYDYFNKK